MIEMEHLVTTTSESIPIHSNNHNSNNNNNNNKETDNDISYQDIAYDDLYYNDHPRIHNNSNNSNVHVLGVTQQLELINEQDYYFVDENDNDNDESSETSSSSLTELDDDSNKNNINPSRQRRQQQKKQQQITKYKPPYGYWKDTVWDCCSLGYCHPTIIVSLCCIPLVSIQLGTRIGYTKRSWNELLFLPTTTTTTTTTTFVSVPSNNKSSNQQQQEEEDQIQNLNNTNTCIDICKRMLSILLQPKIILQLLFIPILYYSIRIILFILIFINDPNIDTISYEEYIEPGLIYTTLCNIDDTIWILYCIWTTILIYRIRSRVRQVYSIPDIGILCSNTICYCCNYCCIVEDCCCAIVCPYLSLMQLLRHTANYQSINNNPKIQPGLISSGTVVQPVVVIHSPTWYHACCTDTGLPPV